MSPSLKHILKVSCSDQMGLVAKITTILLEQDCNITFNHEFVDPPSGQFFMRTVFDAADNTRVIQTKLADMLPKDAQVSIHLQIKKKIVLMATKEAHVLGDLLIKCAYDDMNANIVAVVANHDHLAPLVKSFGVAFHMISAEGLSREEHEGKVLETLGSLEFDFLVLAKYMRILNPAFVKQFPNRIINIHHSFLPAFIGANPYRQAHERGVKVIGATAHFVNHELDEGPIISQGVEAVDHQLTAKDLSKVGRDIEKSTLAKALNKVFSERVFLAGHRTIVF
jgi:formyltetrahydrofolate deformylase